MIEHKFSQLILRWYDQHGRKDLPWQHPRDPYRVWLSEVMLQQTQVKTVIPYFERFIHRFPDITALAAAPPDAVMGLWSGLGYYSRARNLHKTAQILVHTCNGIFPKDRKSLEQLPGIGKTTAAAICAQAFNLAEPILDANVRRVFSRFFMVNETKKLWQKAQECMSISRCADYTQGIMDFGAMCCTAKNPHCSQCPLQFSCKAYQANSVGNYPVRRIKAEKPTRESHFYLLHRQQEVYLIKNPSKGIWGGLWSLPADPNKKHDLVEHVLIREKIREPLFYRTIKHSFSHFHLLLHIWRIPVSQDIPDCNGSWFQPEDLQNIGLATPIQSVIHEYQQEYFHNACDRKIK